MWNLTNMACNTANVKFKLRRGTAQEWQLNPSIILAPGEPGYDSTNFILKIGNGTDIWTALPSVTLSTEAVIDGDNVKFKLRRGTAAYWLANPSIVLAPGEPGYDSTNFILKIGNGTNIWTALPSVTLSVPRVIDGGDASSFP